MARNLAMEDQRCNYCYKFSAFYECPHCITTTYCGTACCRMDKGHLEKCPYLLPRPERVMIVTASNFRMLFGRFMSALLYHWHRVYGVGYAECIIVSSKLPGVATEFRVKFQKNMSKLEDRYTPNMLNFAATELPKEVLEENNVSLLSMGTVVDLSGFEIGVYPKENARKYYHYFSNKIDFKSLKLQVYGIGLSDKPVIGINQDKGPAIFLS